jgi:hypothetical protein
VATAGGAGDGGIAPEVACLLRRRRQHHTLKWVDRRTLFRARNDTLARVLHDPTAEERSRWVASMLASGSDPGFTITLDRRELSFLVVGDPGDGDLSQFCLVPALRAEHERAGTDFMVALSDVIYPAGDINDYADKLYLPYGFYDRPIYAVPGNHDWYDGLNGFMFHFCGAEALPFVAHRPSSEGAAARLARRLWRRASRPDRQRMVALRGSRPPWRSEDDEAERQPGPYFAVDTPCVRFVFIDTGMRGRIDREQAEWLVRVSFDAERKPKVLLTGKPLYVDGKRKPCPIETIGAVDEPTVSGVTAYPTRPGDGQPPLCDVHDVIADPLANYVATIGGDVHNYQRYEVATGGASHHLVSGGGGAYLSAIHRFTDEVPAPAAGGSLQATYPKPAGSVEFYARAIGENAAFLVFYALVVLALGAVVVTALAGTPALEAKPAPSPALALVLGASGTLLALFGAWTRRVRRSWPARFPPPVSRPAAESLQAAGAALLLALLAVAGWRRGWSHVETALALAAAMAATMVGFLLYDHVRQGRGVARWLLLALALVPPAALAVVAVAVFRGDELAWWLLAGAVVATPFSILLVFPERASQVVPGLGGVSALALLLLLALFHWAWAGALLGAVVAGAWILVSLQAQKVRIGASDTARIRARRARLEAIAVALVGLAAGAAGVALDVAIRGFELARELAVFSIVLLGCAALAPLLYLQLIGLVRPALARIDLASIDEEYVTSWFDAGCVRTTAEHRLLSLARELPTEPLRGPLSEFFSEFFDSDVPPLYKSFLRLDVTGAELVITAFGVSGRAGECEQVDEAVRISLGDC